MRPLQAGSSEELGLIQSCIAAASRRKPGPTCQRLRRGKSGPRLSPGSVVGGYLLRGRRERAGAGRQKPVEQHPRPLGVLKWWLQNYGGRSLSATVPTYFKPMTPAEKASPPGSPRC